MKAIKKPVTIDYFPIKVDEYADNIDDLKRWVESFGDRYEDHFTLYDSGPDGAALRVQTLEGTSYYVKATDVIIRGIMGEYYPCKKDIFEHTYDKI